MTRKSKKQFENQSQSGRSMIEMLGVLAIIAILSIGGIVGYKLAMNYYQADQIANEINLMRNDLKVKYALGNEELLLGDPYDDTPENEDYSGHLSTQYDRYPVDYDCIRKDKAEFYNCREADAYYIKVGNVSKGVCKPLTTLVSAMDGLMYMEINKKVYKEDDLCDEANEFYIQFDAEDVNGNYDSNRPEDWCADDDNCPDDKPFCENERCVECIDHTDCTDSTKPRCNDASGNCESCPPETPKWNGHTCVECTTSADCTNLDKPNCNAGTNTCEPCPPEKPLWNGSNCEACPEDEPWNGESCGCKSNNDCETDEYCSMLWLTGNACQIAETGKCKKLGNYQKKTFDNETYYVSDETMTWWSAQNYCQALTRITDCGGNMVSWSKLNLQCANEIVVQDGCKCSDGNCNLDHQVKQCQRLSLAEGIHLYCKKDTTGTSGSSNIPDKLKTLRETFFNNDSESFVWLNDGNNPCYAWVIGPNGIVTARPRYFGRDNLVSDGHAFCY